MTHFIDQATKEIAAANVTILSKDLIRSTLNKLGWSYFYANEHTILTTVRVPIKFWKFQRTFEYEITVHTARPLFVALFGEELG